MDDKGGYFKIFCKHRQVSGNYRRAACLDLVPLSHASMDYWPLLAARENVLNAGADINSFVPVTFDELVENNRNFKRLSAGKE